MLRFCALWICVFALSPVLTEAYPVYPEAEPDPFAGIKEFNGMTLKQFGDFTKWQLVTVRYRRDSNELRFVYANPTAWKELKLGGRNYSDGAVFAKIGIKTQDDSSFPSSAVPSGAARFQFMVKNKSQFKDTDGWGYAIFDAEGKTFGGEPKTTITACHACHRLVPQHDFVFSTPLDLAALVNLEGKNSALPRDSKLEWIATKKKDLPKSITKLLPKSSERIWTIGGNLRDKIFVGTLDEIRPAMIQKTLETGEPSALISNNAKLFTILFKRGDTHQPCANGKKAFQYFIKASEKQIEVAHKFICQ